VAGEAVEATAEDAEATAEDAADPTVDAGADTASPAAWVTGATGAAAAGAAATGAAATGVRGPGEAGAGEAGAGEAGAGEEGAPGSGGNCAAEAGRAKITARIMASTKIAARPPQAHTQARGDQAPTSLASPIRERTGTFASTARKPRRTLRYQAINLTM
jgi:hypothetical protein